MAVQDLFPTSIYYEVLQKDRRSLEALLKELRAEIPKIRDYDVAGRRWCRKNYVGGYTSYGSLSELHQFSSTFGRLKLYIDKHVNNFAKALNADLKNNTLEMTQMWVNVMPARVVHSGHLHPLSSISGTFYVETSSDTSALKFEDPRLACFMGSIPRLPRDTPRSQRFFEIKPKVGYVVLFESWLRHEVPAHSSKTDRVSVSFNYNWF